MRKKKPSKSTPVKKSSTKKKDRKPKPSGKNYKKLLSDLLNENTHRAYSIKQIFKNLNVRNKAAKQKVAEALESLADAGEVAINKHGDFQSNHKGQSYEGVVDYVNPRFAFVICDDLEEDIWVSSENLNFALDGDRVRVRAYPVREGRRPEGKIEAVLERKRDEFVGKIELSERYAFVVADNKKMHLDIFVPNDAIQKATQDDKVIVKVTRWHDEQNSPVGYVKEVLGPAGEHHTEMHAILAEFDLPTTFPPAVLEEAKKIRSRVTKGEIAKRRDLRDTLTFTIDPADAKDFDDALSIRSLEEGHWEIGIHIADVTHYVRPNTALEEEAYKRATSVYLVDRVVPMLPEKLSNDLCSLRPHEDRLTFSAIFEMDEEGKVYKEWFGRTVIHSDHRFSYEDAQTLIENPEGDFAAEITTLNQIAKKLTTQRFEEGAINFETTEVKFKLDKDGRPIGIYIKERQDAHRLIEEFMLLANKKVAEYVFNLRKEGKDKTMVYRIHEKPDMEKLQNFSAFARKFGYDISLEEKAIAASINRLVENTTGSPQQDVLQALAIRTMAKARYSTEAIGHFGLAFPHYTHFTSPIRRYPDMMVHRLLQRYLDEGRSPKQEEYEKKCKHSTEMEKKAADAERASIKYKQVEFMQNAEDKIYDGVVTGVTDWGIYVEITETRCEGMIRMSDLLDDFYELDAENYRIIGKRNKRMISFGDALRVRVKDTNLEKRIMDLTLED